MLHHSIGVNLPKTLLLKILNLNLPPAISKISTNNKIKTKTNLEDGIIKTKTSTISVTNSTTSTLVETLKTKEVGDNNNNNNLLLLKVALLGVNLKLLLHLVITSTLNPNIKTMALMTSKLLNPLVLLEPETYFSTIYSNI